MLTINKTFSLKKSEIKKEWFLVDATDMIVGRLASRIALILKGKHKPCYTPHMDCGDNIVVINADKIKFTGKKMTDKIYYRHSGYMGGLKQTSPKEVMKRFSERILIMAVKRMLGRGPMARKRLHNMFVYQSAEHKHQAQQPQIISFIAHNEKNSIHRSK